MQPSARAEDMQALLVDLRPAPDNLVAGQQQQPAAAPEAVPAPPLTANAVLGRYMGAPLPGPMLARIMPPGGPSALTGIQAGGQSSSIQIQPGGANVVRLSLSNKVFLKDHRKEKKKKKRPPPPEPLVAQAAPATPQPPTPLPVQPEEPPPQTVLYETAVAAGEPMAPTQPSPEEEEPEEEASRIWLWIIIFLLVATVVALAVILLLKPEYLDALLPENPNTVQGFRGRAGVTEPLTIQS
ncbi:hypothetical protein V5799_033321 [Amblyomma americanum]|uniref:Uncharacterized protein n=1 Tax=Amblyomma americanum TaxID=6943 RepID=A0AAQ4DNN1_AMBAM